MFNVEAVLHARWVANLATFDMEQGLLGAYVFAPTSRQEEGC